MEAEKDKILIVEDNESLRITLAEIIQSYCFKAFGRDIKVISAENGKEGLELLKKNPDTILIFTDKNMPGGNGDVFIEKIKSPESPFRDIKVILMTAAILEISTVRDLEADWFLQKPFGIHEIEDIIFKSLLKNSIAF